ncbi:unnamed protein product [Caenorhabditis angaria]|uniref:BTB domain-containing protein n=1 Tax=Caenorhabditis angaria TaxID=860376 RepID=A0A9P1I899_9PELO|nr:unnamed protein product [Caenorhabditis angaria]
MINGRNYIQKDGSMEIEFVFDLKYYDLSIEIPNYTDVTLIVAAEKFYLNKEFLSRLDYFNALFNTKKRPETMFRNRKSENGRIPLFFSIFFFSSADFKFEMMRHKCENYLFNRDDARNHPDYIFKKADEFDLERVLNKFLGFMSERDIKKMKESEDFQNFKDSTKQKIAKKLAKNTYSRI